MRAAVSGGTKVIITVASDICGKLIFKSTPADSRYLPFISPNLIRDTDILLFTYAHVYA
jgi:hypothetical protein